MTILPHRSNPYKLVPLLRKLECQDDVPMERSKSAKLIGLLWEKLIQNERIANFFILQRLLRYRAHGGDREFHAPFLHHFYIPTEHGMNWLSDRFCKKYGFKVHLVQTLEQVLALQDKALASSTPIFEAFILTDTNPDFLHVTPCVFIKNSHGAFLIHIDSMGHEGPVVSKNGLRARLSNRVIMICNTEPRQKDGFSCRVDAFIMIKQIYKAFSADHNFHPQDIFKTFSPINAEETLNVGCLRGAFMKTAQGIISDERREEQLVSSDVRLDVFQASFISRYLRSIESFDACVHDIAISSVYLQCKALKYVHECDAEMTAHEKMSKEVTLSFTEDF